MKLSETWYGPDGRPKGQILRDDLTGKVDFVPRDDVPPPPRRSWQSVDQLKAALIQLYGKPGTPAAALERAMGLRGDPSKISGHGTG